MRADVLRWWLDFMPWSCIGEQTYVRRRRESERDTAYRHDIYLWTNWAGQYLLERGQQLDGEWVETSAVERFNSLVGSPNPFVGEAVAPEVAHCFIHMCTEPQARRLIERYGMYRLGKGYAPEELAAIAGLNFREKGDETETELE